MIVRETGIWVNFTTKPSFRSPLMVQLNCWCRPSYLIKRQVRMLLTELRRAFLSTTNSSVLILTDGLLGLPGDIQRLLLMRCSLLLLGGWCLLATRGPCVFVIESLSLCASLPFLGEIAFSNSLEVRSSLGPMADRFSLGVIMVLTRYLIILLISGISFLSWLDLWESRSL